MTLQAPIDSMPLLVRAGSIVPTGPVKQYAEEPSDEPVTLTVYPGADGRFQFYDDDGVSFAYEHGDYQLIAMQWDDSQKLLTMRHANGDHARPRRFLAKLAGGETRSISLGAGSATVKLG